MKMSGPAACVAACYASGRAIVSGGLDPSIGKLNELQRRGLTPADRAGIKLFEGGQVLFIQTGSGHFHRTAALARMKQNHTDPGMFVAILAGRSYPQRVKRGRQRVSLGG